ncbi:hypothetical protein GCM10022215_00200 [Nocardioides fonticola]|uniref:Transmembrane protein n=1 Tax=Nocardioides fonticola TaxID=450363 RepID=A0ABP7X8K0_9ACTN
MLTALLSSARELRNPLTVGYATLISLWVLCGPSVQRRVADDELGRRLLIAFDDLGDAGRIAIYTFVASMVGSLMWNSFFQRLTAWISQRAHHPDWDSLIAEARQILKDYEEYEVRTIPDDRKVLTRAWGQGGGIHTVPSPQHGAFLMSRVEERERKSAEMSFRVTLATSLLPVSASFGFAGGGWWWAALLSVPLVWADVFTMKYSAEAVATRFKLEDLHERIKTVDEDLMDLERQLAGEPPDSAPSSTRSEIDAAIAQRSALADEVDRLERRNTSIRTRILNKLLGSGA